MYVASVFLSGIALGLECSAHGLTIGFFFFFLVNTRTEGEIIGITEGEVIIGGGVEALAVEEITVTGVEKE